MAQVDETRQQVAVLLVFPEGVTAGRAKEIANYWSRTALGPGEEPRVVEVVPFLPDRGGVCVYQPQGNQGGG